MLDPNIDNTQPTKPGEAVENTQPVSSHPANSGADEPSTPVTNDEPTAPLQEARVRRWPWIVGGVFLILLLGALGGFLGYRAALQLRAQVSAEQIATTATEQFMLGLQEQANGQFDVALKRFQYVIQLDPNFPGAQEKLTEVMMAVAILQTPTVTPVQATPTLTPTPDTRAEEEIFNNAHDLLANKEWSKALEVLDTLRNKNLTYRAVEVDGMYYTALRFQGLAKINGGSLEEGLYDLALVERFAPLDVDANGVRTWARLYLTGAAYWGVRWDQVILYFAQIYPYYPAMRDASGMTALERYRIALIRYGDQLAGTGNYCDAQEQYEAAYQVGPDSSLDPTATANYEQCHPSENTEQPDNSIAPTVAPTTSSVLPTNTQPVVPTNTQAPVIVPTETPQPTEAPQQPTATPQPTEAPPPTDTQAPPASESTPAP